ncbi:hypothetical protein F5884DRAFT_778003 [Xylogone sp. PMI_703]|nr:hypothetical protein F5884DRAFT_778003 [Xylogone sp. PMI_703]
MAPLRLLAASLALFSSVSWGYLGAMRYEPDASLMVRSQPRGLDSKALVSEWLGRRALTCAEKDFDLCSDGSGCCASGNNCCTGGGCCPSGQNCCSSKFCVAEGGDCCDSYTCPPGWKCCGNGTCYPEGGQCCGNGNFCSAGNICVYSQGSNSKNATSGTVQCCTDEHCTAHVNGTVTLTASIAASTATTATVTTESAKETAETTTGAGQLYYYTITWSYTATSGPTTTSTVLTIYATNSKAADSSFSALSATLILPTPTQVAAVTTPASVSATPTGKPAASGLGFKNAGGSMKISSKWSSNWAIAAFTVFVALPGAAMIAL